MQSKRSLKTFAPVHLRTKYELCVPLVKGCYSFDKYHVSYIPTLREQTAEM